MQHSSRPRVPRGPGKQIHRSEFELESRKDHLLCRCRSARLVPHRAAASLALRRQAAQPLGRRHPPAHLRLGAAAVSVVNQARCIRTLKLAKKEAHELCDCNSTIRYHDKVDQQHTAAPPTPGQPSLLRERGAAEPRSWVAAAPQAAACRGLPRQPPAPSRAPAAAQLPPRSAAAAPPAQRLPSNCAPPGRSPCSGKIHRHIAFWI